MSAARRRLPDRRASKVFDFTSMGVHFTASVGRYDDGRIVEVFLDSYKSGSSVSTLVRDLGIVFSFAVQHGADSAVLSRDNNGHPLGTALDRLQQQKLEAAGESADWPGPETR